MRVVVTDVLVEEAAELALVPDEGAAEEFLAGRANPAFREGVGPGCTDRGVDHVGADRGEHAVERCRVLAAAVADHEPGLVGPVHQQIPSGLGGPGPVGVGSDPCEVYSAGVDFDEEEHPVAAQGHGVNTEEVGGDHSFGLGRDELRPGGPRAIRCRLSSRGAQDGPHGGGGDPVSESVEFAGDASVSPCRVLAVEPQHEPSQLRGRSRPSSSGSLVRVGPAACDQATVPADHRRGLHDQHHPLEASSVEGLGHAASTARSAGVNLGRGTWRWPRFLVAGPGMARERPPELGE